ncbi:dipeptidase PepV [Clostridium tyrobutyricum]|uniref:dipeptidase PepV n=1 Tax=Clostridium tyrobutyricum TaxID=1519 RepID=UPI00057FC7EA|nr:dipeptidase PepV [Clostridium tyrobutyricum]
MGINDRVEEIKDEMIKSIKEIVQIKSVTDEKKPGKPFGEGVSKALDKALEISERLGFKTKNLDGYVGYAEYGEGEDYVAVLGHLDVVPEGKGWEFPPYGAEIHDGKMYGRGTMDDKGPIITTLYSLKVIKDLKLPLSKRVRIIFGTNEENGCSEIQYYKDREKPPIMGFTPDGDYPIIYAEKGIVTFDLVKNIKVKPCGDISIEYIEGGERANVVPNHCEVGLKVKNPEDIIKSINKFCNENSIEAKVECKKGLVVITVTGLAAHGSTPELGKNAVMQIFKILGALKIEKSDISDVIDFFNRYVGYETDGKSFGLSLEDKESGKLTFNIGAAHMKDNKISIAFNLRYPVTFKYEDMMGPFNNRISGLGFGIQNMMHQKPLFFPEKHPLIKILQKVYTEQTGEEAKLLAIGGGTYAKDMPNMVAFGPMILGEPETIHNSNEYIKIDHIIRNAKIYAHAIYELAK